MDPSHHDLEPIDRLNSEIELIISSLLPFEALTSTPPDTFPRKVDIISQESKFYIHFEVGPGFPSKNAILIEIKGAEVGN